jgi:hypothetical protein
MLFRVLAVGIASFLVLLVPGRAQALRIGFFDPEATSFTLSRAQASGAADVRVGVTWALVAPSKPTSPANADEKSYRWAAADAAVQEVTSRGLRPIVAVAGAPSWAEARHRPAGVLPGTWKPDPHALADFMTALARRYRGRVHDYQLWNEPNLDRYLAPQWVRTGTHSYKAFAPDHYRKMLNAAYRAIKAVDPTDRLITGGTAPYGDPQPGGSRIMPARFWRDVLCLDGRLHRTHCSDPAHFDVLAHHPYAIGGPRRHALNGDDIAVPDMGKLSRILAAARRHGTALPRNHKPLWVTEISWDSKPPDPFGVPAKRHAAWLSDALYTLWKQHVRVVLWFRVVDQPPVPSYALTNQSGLYLRNGHPKPAQRAFAFPVACERTTGGRFRVWGMAPVPSADATIQVRERASWHTAATRRAGSDRVFTFVGRGSPKLVRAVQGAATSLTCVPST